MTEKRAHEYQIDIKHIKDIKGNAGNEQQVNLLFKNHDDIFKIMDMLTEKQLFENPQEARQFVLGLKLLGDVIMRNKQMELFSEMQPAFLNFMQKLKSKVK